MNEVRSWKSALRSSHMRTETRSCLHGHSWVSSITRFEILVRPSGPLVEGVRPGIAHPNEGVAMIAKAGSESVEYHIGCPGSVNYQPTSEVRLLTTQHVIRIHPKGSEEAPNHRLASMERNLANSTASRQTIKRERSLSDAHLTKNTARVHVAVLMGWSSVELEAVRP